MDAVEKRAAARHALEPEAGALVEPLRARIYRKQPERQAIGARLIEHCVDHGVDEQLAIALARSDNREALDVGGPFGRGPIANDGEADPRVPNHADEIGEARVAERSAVPAFLRASEHMLIAGGTLRRHDERDVGEIGPDQSHLVSVVAKRRHLTAMPW